MFIETQPTPNPATLKFIPGSKILDGNGVEYRSADKAKTSPLAMKLFELEAVASVFIGSDFVAVTKKHGEWSEIKKDILGQLIDHFISGEPAVKQEALQNPCDDSPDNDGDGDADIVNEIRRLIDTRVRPAVAHDGGDIIFHKYDKGIVYLQMRGACSGCPISSVTLKQGIENLLKHFISEVQEVRAIEA